MSLWLWRCFILTPALTLTITNTTVSCSCFLCGMNCSIQWTSCSTTGWQMNMDYGWDKWTCNANVLAEQSVTMPLFSTQIPHGLSWDWTRPFTVKKRYNIPLWTRKLRRAEKLHDRWHRCHKYGVTGVTAHHTTMHTFLRICMHTFAAYIHKYVGVYIYIIIYIYTYIHTYIHTHTHTYIHPYIHTHIHTYTQTHIHTYIHTHIHTYIHAYINAYIHTYIHTHTHSVGLLCTIDQLRRRACYLHNKQQTQETNNPCSQRDLNTRYQQLRDCRHTPWTTWPPESAKFHIRLAYLK